MLRGNLEIQYYGKGGPLLDDGILETTKDAIGLIVEDTSFDAELLLHINAALSTLYQNGIGKPVHVDRDDKWSKFVNDEQNQNDYMFGQIKQYVFLETKILFDPPPPSTVEYVKNAADSMLWRLRENYDVMKEGLYEE